MNIYCKLQKVGSKEEIYAYYISDTIVIGRRLTFYAKPRTELKENQFGYRHFETSGIKSVNPLTNGNIEFITESGSVYHITHMVYKDMPEEFKEYMQHMEEIVDNLIG